MTSENADEVAVLPVFTLVLWLICLFVGLAGLLMQTRHPAPATQPTTLATEILDVEIADDVPAPEATPPPNDDAAPALPQPFAVVEPSPAIAFALPVEASVHPAIVAAPAAQAPVQLTFGEGEGKQPKPEYPIEAAIAREQGTVGILLTVGEDGRVLSAEATSPSRWPMLNQSALRTIRRSWRFPAGRARSYQIAIQFVLNQ
jgi:protein TonB